jgi:hypothetical protein
VATDDVGLETGTLERVHHVDGARVHQLEIDAVHAGRHLSALAELAGLAAAGLAQEFVYEFFDHAVE